MIKEIIITEQITIPPKFLNDKLMSTIESIFSKKVINRCDDETGYIMELITIQGIKGGNIMSENADVIYDVSAKVKTYTIDKDEIIKGIVFKIDNKGLFAQSGPFQIYIAASKIPSSYRFENGYYKGPNGVEIKLNSMIDIKVIGKKLSGVNKMVVGMIPQ